MNSAATRNPLKSDHKEPKKNAGQHQPFFTARNFPFELEYTLNSFKSAPVFHIFSSIAEELVDAEEGLRLIPVGGLCDNVTDNGTTSHHCQFIAGT
jgi:hypothetical protein